jgi:hypothetical protein
MCLSHALKQKSSSVIVESESLYLPAIELSDYDRNLNRCLGGIPIAKYLEQCKSSDKTLIKLLSKDFEDRGRYRGVRNPVATTWLISFQHISRDNPVAARYLSQELLQVAYDAAATKHIRAKSVESEGSVTGE